MKLVRLYAQAIPAITPIPCTEKNSLIVDYQQATRDYAAAVAELNQRIGRSSKTEYDAIYRLAENGRLRSIAAKDALDKHTNEHGC